ncbi:M1 family aminopeptidase [Paraflavisolibacter sp. H34]|uniref:M1 family aminopeptidase n=1 Tax=Huijunlia imazamoxiresistens TaxID=3127457 RepID=UPI0030178C38
MKAIHLLQIGVCVFCGALAFSCSRPAYKAAAQPREGVPQPLAVSRKKLLSDLRYQLYFNVPEKREDSIAASATLYFRLKKRRFPLQLDFKEKGDHLLGLRVNEVEQPVVLEHEHLLLRPKYLKKGLNKVALRFTAGDLSLNRNEDYLYTLLVPDRARTAFPCFDQPDLKAVFTLSLTTPAQWSAIANAPLVDSVRQGGTMTWHYAPTDTIPTYLFSFAAGRFSQEAKEAGGRSMHFFHRETDKLKLAQSMDTVFALHAGSLDYLQQYTGIPYPFQKFDFVAIPDFQYGGMEHPGAILYKAASLFLDGSATQEQKISRSSVIAHETAHMWFGNLVTMRWFDDVWMKEVFANFLADKITQRMDTTTDFDLKFLLDHLPAAYSIDRTAGANPVRQPLANLQDAGSLYGSIIYHKAPVMMRQLERLMGEEAFRKGLQTYLKTYAYGNASWPDLITILDALTPADLQAWNKVWVNMPGRPLFDYDLQAEGGRIRSLEVRQQAPEGGSRTWPQLFELALVYPDRVEQLTVNSTEHRMLVKEAEGKPAPLFLLFNATGQGYGLFPVDGAMRLDSLKSPVMRASAYINLYENMLAGRQVSPLQLLDLYRPLLSSESEELNLRLMTGQIMEVFWHYTLPAHRAALAGSLEADLWQAMLRQREPNKKKILFKTYQGLALSRKALDNLYEIWKLQKPPSGVRFSEDDYTSLAFSLAVRDYPAAKLLQEQQERIQNPDRKRRMAFVLPALSPEVRTRDAFFRSLKEPKNREKESWVLLALDYLHHPLRAATSRYYLKESLELLDELQRTGDIFFPQSWLQRTLSPYQTPGDAAVVRSFLKEHPAYNPKLKEKILQAADPLFRAERLLYPPGRTPGASGNAIRKGGAVSDEEEDGEN